MEDSVTRTSRDVARDWVDELLARLRTGTPPDRALFLAEAAALPLPIQVGVLKECVERMPALRSEDARHASWVAGSALYDLACHLYGRELPYEEDDVCALLQRSRHACGHGEDVTQPLDIAQSYMREHGFSEVIAAAARQFLDGLKGVGSSQAHFAKRRAAIMLLADPTERPGDESGWGAHFRAGLRDLPGPERSEWQRLVLSMKANDVYVPPAVWQKPARTLLAALPSNVVLDRIERWISVENSPELRTVRTGGSHVLKHLVWLFYELSAKEDLQPTCDAVVVRLLRIDWLPKERAAKFMIAAASYLSRRPPEVAEEPLRQLARWSGDKPGKIGDLVRRYGGEHGLQMPEPVASVADHRKRLPRKPAPASPGGSWLAKLLGFRRP